MLVSYQTPEEFIPQLLSPDCHNIVVFQKEFMEFDMIIEDNLNVILERYSQFNDISVSSHNVWSSTLYHVSDLNYDARRSSPLNYP